MSKRSQKEKADALLSLHRDGGLRPWFVLPARKLHPSGRLSFDQLALVETLAIGCHAVNRAAPRADESCLIIGAGHNGLVCAFYLARAGLKVRMVERRNVVGGAAVTEEFHPGVRNSVASYTVSLLQHKVIRDVRLAERG